MWTNFNAALKAGNEAAAIELPTSAVMGSLAVEVDLIMPTASTVVAGYSPIVLIFDAYDISDYLVARTVNGVRLVSALRFMRMDDGSWRLDQL